MVNIRSIVGSQGNGKDTPNGANVTNDTSGIIEQDQVEADLDKGATTQIPVPGSPVLINVTLPIIQSILQLPPSAEEVEQIIGKLRGIFHGDLPENLDTLADQLARVAERHGPFFREFHEALVTREDEKTLPPNEQLEKKLERIRLLEHDNLTKPEALEFFNWYRDLSMKDLVRFYERLQEAKRNGGLTFEITPTMTADYVLALNRLGKTDEAIAKATTEIDEFLPTIQRGHATARGFIPQMEIFAELLIGVGTAYKNKFFASGFNDEESLRLSGDAYEQAFEVSKSYYAGINLVRNLIYRGGENTEKAKQLSKLVKETAYMADTDRSFWTVTTLLEIALLNGDKDEISKRLPQVLSFIPKLEKTDVDSLLSHLKLWKQLKQERNENPNEIRALEDVISQIERVQSEGRYENPNQVTPEDGFGRYISVDQAVRESCLTFGCKTRRDVTSHPFNATRGPVGKDGGLVVNVTEGLGDRGVIADLLSVPLSQLGIKVKGIERTDITINDIKDQELAAIAVRELVEKLFVIRNPKTGKRDIENMDEKRHIELEAFWWGLLDLVNNKYGKMSACGTSVLAASGRGDCRHTNIVGCELLTQWKNNQMAPIIDDAFSAWKRGDLETYNSALEKMGDLNCHDYAVELISIYAPVKNKGTYQIVRDENGNGIFDYDPSSPMPKIDEHAVCVERVCDRSTREIKEKIIRDMWYTGEELLTLGRAQVKGQNLEDLRILGCYFIQKGAQVSSGVKGDSLMPISVKLEPLSFSKEAHVKAHRYDSTDTVFLGFDVEPPPIEIFTDTDMRERFQHSFTYPVILRGLIYMMNNRPSDKLRACEYLLVLAEEPGTIGDMARQCMEDNRPLIEGLIEEAKKAKTNN